MKGNVKDTILNAIQRMYVNFKSSVMLNKELPEAFVYHAGVRQGENLSPILFAYYINDIEEELLNKNCNYLDFGEDFVNRLIKILFLMYADDTVILCDSDEEMRRVLLPFYSYSNEWKITVTDCCI